MTGFTMVAANYVQVVISNLYCPDHTGTDIDYLSVVTEIGIHHTGPHFKAPQH